MIRVTRQSISSAVALVGEYPDIATAKAAVASIVKAGQWPTGWQPVVGNTDTGETEYFNTQLAKWEAKGSTTTELLTATVPAPNDPPLL